MFAKRVRSHDASGLQVFLHDVEQRARPVGELADAVRDARSVVQDHAGRVVTQRPGSLKNAECVGAVSFVSLVNLISSFSSPIQFCLENIVASLQQCQRIGRVFDISMAHGCSGEVRLVCSYTAVQPSRPSDRTRD